MPTPAELEAEKKKQEQEQSSIWSTLFDKLSPANWDFGSMFMVCIVAFVGFMVAGSDWGREMLHKFDLDNIGETLHDWKSKLMAKLGSLVEKVSPDLAEKFGLSVGAQLDKTNAAQAAKLMDGQAPAAIVAIITRDDDSWNKLKAVIKSANGGKLNMDITNPNTLVALITTKDAKVQTMVGDILTAVQSGKGTPTDAEIKMKKDLQASVLSIVSGPGLNQMLSPDNRARTLTLLDTFQPGAKMLLQLPGMLDADGATAHGQKTLAYALTPDASGNLPNAQQVLKAALDSDAVRNDPDAQKKAAEVIKQGLPDKVGEVNAAIIGNHLSPEQLVNFTNFIGNDDKDSAAAMKKYVEQNLPSFAAIAKDPKLEIDKLPATSRKSIQALRDLPDAAIQPLYHIALRGVDLDSLKTIAYVPGTETLSGQAAVANLLNGENRALIRATADKNHNLQDVADFLHAEAAANPDLKDYQSLLTEHNLQVLLAADDRIGGNPANKNPVGPDQKPLMGPDNKPVLGPASKVLSAFLNYSTYKQDDPKKKDVLNALDPKDIAAFFSDPTNQEAFHILLGGLRDVPGQQGQVLKALNDNWGNKDHGLAAVLANGDGAAFLKSQMLNEPNAAGEFFSGMHLIASGYLMKQGGVVSDNRDAILNLKDALEEAHALPAKQINMAAFNSMPLIP